MENGKKIAEEIMDNILSVIDILHKINGHNTKLVYAIELITEKDLIKLKEANKNLLKYELDILKLDLHDLTIIYTAIHELSKINFNELKKCKEIIEIVDDAINYNLQNISRFYNLNSEKYLDELSADIFSEFKK